MMESVDFKAMLTRYWIILLTFILGAVFFIIAIRLVDPVEYPNKDFFTFWLGGHLTILGRNPYLSDIWIGGHHQFGASWIPNATYIYPLPLTLFFAPLGLLSLYQAFIVWITLSQFMIVFSAALILKLNPNPHIKHYVLPLLAGIVLFRPTLLTLFHGQLSGLLLFVIACVVYLWEKGKWWQGGTLLPILALKPNLGIPIILLLMFYLLLQKKIKSLFVLGASGLALLLIGLVQDQNWILEFLKAGNTKLSETFGYSPTVWGMSSYLCNYKLNCSIGYGGFISILLLVGSLCLIVKKHDMLTPKLAASLAVTLTLLITPYTWPYDQLLLVIPIIVVTLELVNAGYKFLPTAMIFLFLDIFSLIFDYISIKSETEFWNVSIPLVVFCLLVWYLSKGKLVIVSSENI